MTDGVEPKQYLTMQDRDSAQNLKESIMMSVAGGRLAWLGRAVMQGIYILCITAVALILADVATSCTSFTLTVNVAEPEALSPVSWTRTVTV